MKEIMKISKTCSFILGLTLLSGCLPQQIELKKFPIIKKASGYYDNREDVIVAVKAFNKEECKAHFGVDITAKNYVALQLRIENRTPDTYIIRPSYLSLAVAEPQKIAKLLHYDTSFFITTAGAIALLFYWPATYLIGRTGFDMYQNNRRINSIIADSSLSEEQSLKIRPYEVVNKFIFVNRYEFTNNFTLKLFNKNQRKALNFFVSLT
jgi:hypothetical protein